MVAGVEKFQRLVTARYPQFCQEAIAHKDRLWVPLPSVEWVAEVEVWCCRSFRNKAMRHARLIKTQQNNRGLDNSEVQQEYQ